MTVSDKPAPVSLQTAVLLIAAALPAICYALQGRVGFSLWDEGLHWYGSQRVMAGEVPIRDFVSYDIGRYYWSAAVMSLLGSTGILAMRVSNVVLQAISVVVATYLVTRSPPRQRVSFALLVAGTFTLWMVRWDFKAADYAASILLIFALAFVLELPTLRRTFVCGVVVGFVAILGRNHGVYGALASLGGIAYLAYKKEGARPLVALSAWSGGVIVGYLPMLLALMVVPGFARAYWEVAVKFLIEVGTTNLPLPWPRPWWVHFDTRHDWLGELRHLLVGLLFIALPLFGLAGLSHILRRHSSQGAAMSPVFMSAALLALPYAHYTYSRADTPHLSFGIFPLLIGALMFRPAASSNARLALAGGLFAASLFLLLPDQPRYQALRAGNWETVIVGTDTLTVRPDTASELSLLETLADRYAPNGRSFVATPLWPGAYAVLNRRAPMWEVYALLPRTEAFQRTEIARIEAADPGLAVVVDWPVDGRDDRRYHHTHPLIERYISATFQLLRIVEIDARRRIRIYVRTAGDHNGIVPNLLPTK